MFIFNLKINSNKLGKIFLGILFTIIIIITIFVCYKILGNNSFKINDNIKVHNVQELTTNNYTNVLQTVHDNLNDYIGLKIKFSGYVYRMIDFKENQFVLARDMVISSDNQTVVVGFLCEHKTAASFNDFCWVAIEGEITKGDYHGEIPIIKITSINQIDKPSDVLVYPPDDSFVPTSTIL